MDLRQMLPTTFKDAPQKSFRRPKHRNVRGMVTKEERDSILSVRNRIARCYSLTEIGKNTKLDAEMEKRNGMNATIELSPLSKWRQVWDLRIELVSERKAVLEQQCPPCSIQRGKGTSCWFGELIILVTYKSTVNIFKKSKDTC
ncbi:uncharacterized protein LOC144622856 [Crassostrea virginica]